MGARCPKGSKSSCLLCSYVTGMSQGRGHTNFYGQSLPGTPHGLCQRRQGALRAQEPAGTGRGGRAGRLQAWASATSSSCVPSSCGTNWLLLTGHLRRRCCSPGQAALRLLARIKQRGFRIHQPGGDPQPHSEGRFTHSFIRMMLSPAAPAVLSRQFVFKQARFYVSQRAAPAIRDQFIQDGELC